MAGGEEGIQRVTRRRCPRCEICGVVVRVRGVGQDGVWCSECMGPVLPFGGISGGL